MKKFVIIIGILIFSFLSCKKDNVEQINPQWINTMVDTIKTQDSYWGSIIYRHDWKSKYYYHLMIPLSSCAYCNVYDENGEKVNWSTENSQDYMQNRKNEVIIWKWSK
jgi:thioredoxin-related protein